MKMRPAFYPQDAVEYLQSGRVTWRARHPYKADHAARLLGVILAQCHKKKFRLSSTVLQREVHNYASYLSAFLEAGFFKTNGSYNTGRAREFEPTELFCCFGNYRRVEVRDAEPRVGLNADPVGQQLLTALRRLCFNRDKAADWLTRQTFPALKSAHYELAFDRIAAKDFQMVRDKNGRVHHNLTNLSAWIRKNCFSFEGAPGNLVEVDWRSAHPTLLVSMLATLWGSHAELTKLATIVKDGNVAGCFENDGETLTDAKRKERIWGYLFGKRRSSAKDLATRAFERKFPHLHRDIEKLKRRADNKWLANQLQKLEADFVFGMLWPRLVAAEIDAISIHDGLLVAPQNAHLVVQIFQDALDAHFVLQGIKYGSARIKQSVT